MVTPPSGSRQRRWHSPGAGREPDGDVGALGPQCSPGSGGWWQRQQAVCAHLLLAAWRAALGSWPHVKPALAQALRLHLALFYLSGAFYTLPHRLAGVRYAATSRPLQPG